MKTCVLITVVLCVVTQITCIVFPNSKENDSKESLGNRGDFSRFGPAGGIYGQSTDLNLADTNQFPWHVSIKVTKDAKITYCAGSIIAPTWVLTSGSCIIDGATYTMGFGSNNINVPATTRVSTNGVQQPGYNRDLILNYMGLIRLDTPLVFDVNIQSIRLSSLSQISSSFENYQATVVGFGRPDANPPVLLKYKNLRIISHFDCQTLLKKNKVVSSSTICALNLINDQPSYGSADIGTGLVINESGTWTLIGYYTFGSSSRNIPSGYNKISPSISWIQSYTGIQPRPGRVCFDV